MRAAAVGMVVVAAAAVLGCADEPGRLRWGVGTAVFDARALGLGGDAPASGLIDAVAPAVRIALPTYDGSGQVVHPDILVENSRLVMAMTPYPFSDDTFENPSVVVSTDGTTFTAVPGADPIVGPPPIDHNDDPDIRIDPRTGEYEVLYLETLRPERQNLVALRSRDLATWSRRTAIAYDLAAGAPFIVSPAAIEVAGATHLFAVDLAPDGQWRIVRMVSGDGQTWDATTAAPIALDTGRLAPWHLDVFAVPGGYAMLISALLDDFSRQSLYLATSPDLAAWTLRPAPLLDEADPALALTSLYRATGAVSGDRLVIWYSHKYRD